MKIISFLLIAIFPSVHLLAQQEAIAYKSISSQFEKYYNSNNFDSIFGLFSPEMQSSLPLEKTSSFLNGLQTQAGSIKKMQFTKFNDKKIAVYKTNFERAMFGLYLSLNSESKINGLFIKPFTDETQATPTRNKTKLSLPFNDEWTVIWGGDTKEQNYHVKSTAQKNAFDLVITDDSGKSYKTDGKTNQDYYAFGKEIIAPCDAKVVLVVDGVKENAVGEMNTFNVGGNTVVLKTENNEFLVFCHFKHGSIKVKEDQKVSQGQVLGFCGNTGNSSEPHLHFHIQNIEDLDKATGIKCYFNQLKVNNKPIEDYSPIQNDRIKNKK